MIFSNFSFIFFVDIKTILYGHKHLNFTFQQILKKQNIQKTTFIRAAKSKNIRDKIFSLSRSQYLIIFFLKSSRRVCIILCWTWLWLLSIELSAINLKFMGLFFHYVTSNPPQPVFIFLRLIITEYRPKNLTIILQESIQYLWTCEFVWKF